MAKEWRWWLAQVGTAGGVGFLSSYFTGEVPVSVLYGLFAGTVFYVLREHARLTSALERRVQNWEDKALGLPEIAGDLDEYIRQEVRSKREELLRLATGAKSGEIVLRSRSVQQAAIDFLKQAKSGEKIFATSYVNPDTFWCTPEGELYRQACFDLCNRDVEITRVFIERARAGQREKQCILDETEHQKGKSNLKLRKTLESRLPTEARKDMLLIPGRYVAYLGIGTGDVLEELKVYTSTEELARAKRLSEEIITLSDECK